MFGIEIILLGVWIFLAWMVWKKKIVSKYLRAVKTFLIIAGVSGAALVILLISVMIYYFAHGLEGMSETADAIAHYIGFSLLGMFYIATIGGLVIFLIGRRKPT